MRLFRSYKHKEVYLSFPFPSTNPKVYTDIINVTTYPTIRMKTYKCKGPTQLACINTFTSVPIKGH